MRYLQSQRNRVILADIGKPLPGTKKRHCQGQNILTIGSLEDSHCQGMDHYLVIHPRENRLATAFPN
jgi:hypothetical protein